MTPGRTTRTGARTVAAVSLAALTGLALAGCANGSTGGSDDSSDGGKIRVVTSTNVYSDLASQVGGDKVEATPVIDSSAQDPHSYEATPQDRLRVGEAELVVENGGGYDEFLSGLTSKDQRVVDAVDVSGLRSEEQTREAEDHSHAAEDGHHHDHGDFNEHVWYDVESMQKVVDAIAAQLGEVDQENKDYYSDNAERVSSELGTVRDEVSKIGASGGYVATEPVPGYLLEDAGLHDDTPAEFTAAIDSESDASPAVFSKTVDLVKSEHVSLLAFNKQTSTGQTEKLRTAAQDSGTPVVEFTETIPDGQNYQQWMTENTQHVAQALTK
ncbi:metal ABC transporter solute-binding protein, Zn/Mn family [Kocuria varians]|uniref:Manganese ABC transporter substrate-binding lipoprotein n=1 Tax=Kocuria varians TaxID=1272 RepID=A0A7D7L3P1_KOCVA|nr:zinc ABC transporter substrate-binding protein [Kocuria varians]QMS57484.1 Manganese ABC transporter substrate-binding lipoprotein [Kocuria varians]